MKIVVTAGGTMGHINPALAIIDEFKKREKKLDVIYIGTHNRMEKDIIPAKGIRYIPIEIYGFGRDMKRNIKNIFLIKKAVNQCKELLKKEKPDVVIGVGGYVTFPVLKAASSMGIKTFIHEQNSIPGKSNKMISKYADLIGITFEESEKYFKTKGKIIYTGHPCGPWALEIPKKDKEELGFTKGKKLVTFVSGSLGSGSINGKMQKFLENAGSKKYEICYITGKGHYDSFIEGKKYPENVKIFPYMEELPGLLKVSDLVVSRAGAGSLTEIIALQIPSIIIPSPNVANNHQYYNAKSLADKKCIHLLEEKDIEAEKLEQIIDKILNNSKLRMDMRIQMKKMQKENSSQIIYEALK